MTEQELIQTFTAIIRDFGLWAIFAWLYIRERDAHNETIRHRIDDLREQAGYKSNFALRQIDTSSQSDKSDLG